MRFLHTADDKVFIVEGDPVFSRLQKLMDKASTINNLNYGGCCVFASLAADLLQHIPSVRNVCLRVAHWSAADSSNTAIEDARKQIIEVGEPLYQPLSWYLYGDITFGHVIVEFEYRGHRWHFDSEHLVESSGEMECEFSSPLYGGKLKIEDGLELGIASDDWNTCFDRDNIPVVKQMINTCLLDLAKF